MLKIDKYDRKLLFELWRNCRQPDSRLAKATGISKQRVHYRIGRLVRMGILGDKVLRVDAGRLGYHNYGVYLQWDDVSVKEAFIAEVTADPSVRYAAECSGRVDFVVSFYARNPLEFQRIWDRYASKYGAAMRAHSIHLATENRAFDKSYLVGNVEDRSESFLGSPEKTVVMDGTDKKVLLALQRDCRAPVVSIAEACSIAPETVRARIKRMEKEALIWGYGWIFSTQKAGILLYELLLSLRNMDSRAWDALLAYCRSNPNITYYIRSIGSYDADLIFEVSSDSDFDSQLDRLKKRLGRNIHDFEIAKITREHRFTYLPPL